MFNEGNKFLAVFLKLSEWARHNQKACRCGTVWEWGLGCGEGVREVGCRDAQALKFKRALMTVILSAKILNLWKHLRIAKILPVDVFIAFISFYTLCFFSIMVTKIITIIMEDSCRMFHNPCSSWLSQKSSKSYVTSFIQHNNKCAGERMAIRGTYIHT